MKRKAFSLAALLLVVASMVLWAGGASEKTPANPSTQPKAAAAASPLAYLNLEGYRPVVKDGKIKLTGITVVSDTMEVGNPNDCWWIAFVDKVLNIQIKLEYVTQSASKEKKNLLFASNDLPDLIMAMGLTASELVTYGQVEKQLLPINKYIDPYMPAMMSLKTDFPSMLPSCTCPDGNIYTIPRLLSYKDAGQLPNKVFVNTAWLKKLNMDEPATLDEFYKMLSAFKTKDPAGIGTGKVIPLGGSFASYAPSNFLYTAYGFVVTSPDPLSPMLRGGEVEMIGGSKLYREYLTMMNRMYREGLIHKDFYTLDTTQTTANNATGYVGVMTNVPYLSLPKFEDFDKYKSMTPLTSAYNAKPLAVSGNPISLGNFVVSAKCKYPEAVARMVDYFFTKEGTIYCFDGPVSRDSPDALGMKSIWGWRWDEASNSQKMIGYENGTYPSAGMYTRTYVIPWYDSIIGNRSDISNTRRVAYGLKPLPADVWDLKTGEGNFRDSVAAKLIPYLVDRFPDNVYFTTKEALRVNELKTVLKTYVDTETAKFITGVNSLDKIDSYYREIERLGFPEYQKYYMDVYASYKKASAR
jgi:putative aldouronate transport system substrate-binding protein